MSLKTEVILLAQAHLRNVESLISDLEKKSADIAQEINKLQDYLKLGANNIEKFSQEENV